MGSHQTPHAFGGSGQHREHDVRSVQRMSLPPGRNAHWVAQEYMRWLPKLLPFILGVNVTPDEVCTFRLFGIPLLVLEYAKPRSTPDRALFYIRGGYLARIQGRGRLEFRMLPKESILLAAIHEFRPRLPWRIYSYTQAKAHLWVMRAFGRHLRKLTSAGSVRESLA